MKNKCRETLFETSSTPDDFIKGVARAKCIKCKHEILITLNLIKLMLKESKVINLNIKK